MPFTFRLNRGISISPSVSFGTYFVMARYCFRIFLSLNIFATFAAVSVLLRKGNIC